MQEQIQHDIRELQGQVFGDDEKHEIGLKRRQAATDVEINGSGGELGIKQKVQILWRVHVWVIFAMGGAVGTIMTIVVQRLTKVYL